MGSQNGRNKERIFLSPPHMSEQGFEEERVRESFESNYVAPAGPQLMAFEGEFSQIVGVSHACAVSSGSAALHLALLGLGVKSGDRVYCSTFTFAASAFPILYCGAQPVFVDSEPQTWNMDSDLLASSLEEDARAGRLPAAVIVVDLYGMPANYDRIVEACQEFQVPIVEDAAEALGSMYNGRAAGACGQVGIFSFNGNKIITTGGGGMLVSNDDELVAAARHLSTQAREPYPHYEHEEVGYNYRLSGVLASIGRGQLRVLNERVRRRREVFQNYERLFEDRNDIEFVQEPEGAFANRWLSTILVRSERGCPGILREALESNNIEARPLWKPMHMQPVFQGTEAVGGTVSEDLFRRGVCLPSGSGLSEAQQSLICEIICEALDGSVVYDGRS